MFFRSLVKVFESGNVCVTGLRGRGKDMLMSNVIARRGQIYVSNMDYKCRPVGHLFWKKRAVYLPLNFDKIGVKNNYRNFIENEIVPYDYPYPEGSDIYLSDAGVYFPAQYNGELNKKYSEFPVFQALSRHLGDCNFHVNVQNLNRVWDKIREQSDIYIRCECCHVFGKFVIQVITIYDKYDSCLNRVQPYKHINAPLFGKQEARAQYLSKDQELYRSFVERNGSVKRRLLIYKNRSSYNTRLFKSILSKKELDV